MTHAARIASSSSTTSGEGRSRLDGPSPHAPRLIGVGVDATPSGRDAAAFASRLGRSTGAELMLIAAVQEPLVLLPAPGETSWKTTQKRARSTLATIRDAFAPEARIVIQTGAVESRAVQSIVRLKRCDLLVIGSARDGVEGQAQLGQTAVELLDYLDRPVAIVPRGMRHVERLRLRRIGVGFDAEPEAQAALQWAASIATAAGARLEVLAVVDDRGAGGRRGGQLVPRGAALPDRTTELLDRARTAVQAIDVPNRVQVSRGNPPEALQSFAATVDLVVIGSSRSGPADRLSLGRTAKAVVNGSPGPVMIVPRPRDPVAADR